MIYFALKWSAASIIFVISCIAGLASLRLASQYQRFLAIGSAAANGIFLGAAIFHLIPHAIHGLYSLGHFNAYAVSICLVIISLILLVFLDRSLRQDDHKSRFNAWLLTLTLSIHAFIAGLALGITENISLIIAILVAMVAHKGFEVFALVLNLYRTLQRLPIVIFILVAFALITPFGILLGCYSDYFLHADSATTVTACFNAFAAGTFIYIATAHDRRHRHAGGDSYVQYNHFLATLGTFSLMGLLAIWV
ncbi:MAG: ZIP family metal transporter [Gammaproteobacteria bacterium]|nr:ZIP family metal transporter [Gammaproteobacteria bacterium]